ncbi:MAG: hypothetical protein UX84_C0028G0008 [Microgenomates group bacterium GW2011_GWD1_47_13]|uniref:DUF1648 domain-containing protein n=2 Tax=Candidatus Collieribacteriota TaxID=1752725 RepID=A0A1F5FYX4_9BACT|nr:MAG: hypothetical protein UX84_C0028G0008 [Microgenomates group bacterium GW2011_GWD1_47_13]OGD70594.1 MAG: hypothetical protein A2187_00135 [Candidatus Collierbacteria bacterium RIFOXYA1_FULL_46_24]OGD75379.1 MAG: hypothetical protein A2228_00615 [Candidatus Collierbacteria bacterium RIFOXYA2_FULL_46_10]OGD84810.1 MAG: hypothetical protein A2618_02950 [Candidatus Collierbacteria bacterium RIFOXYD1_FULL_46_26]
MKRTFNISKTAEELVPDKLSRASYWGAIGMVVVMIGGIILVWGKLPNVVPLWFAEPWGEARLANKLWLWLIPATGLGTVGVNVLLAKVTGKMALIIPRVLAVAAGVVSLTLLLGLYGVIQSLFI